MELRHIGGKFQEAVKLLLVGADIHRGPREDVAGTHQYRETDLLDEFVDVGEACQLAPAGLVHAYAVEHGREFVAVFGVVD